MACATARDGIVDALCAMCCCQPRRNTRTVVIYKPGTVVPELEELEVRQSSSAVAMNALPLVTFVGICVCALCCSRTRGSRKRRPARTRSARRSFCSSSEPTPPRPSLPRPSRSRAPRSCRWSKCATSARSPRCRRCGSGAACLRVCASSRAALTVCVCVRARACRVGPGNAAETEAAEHGAGLREHRRGVTLN
jgi:hypothetical protein